MVKVMSFIRENLEIRNLDVILSFIQGKSKTGAKRKEKLKKRKRKERETGKESSLGFVSFRFLQVQLYGIHNRSLLVS